MTYLRISLNLLFVSLVALQSSATAGTATWLGQPPLNPERISAWSSPSYWNDGVIPNSPTARVQLPSASAFNPYDGTYVDAEYIQIQDMDVVVDSLTYESLPSSDDNYQFPVIIIGTDVPGSRASLGIVGAGIISSSSAGTVNQPSFLILNGSLVFSGSASANTPVNLVTESGNQSQIWFRDDSAGRHVTVLLRNDARLDVTNHAILSDSTLQVAQAEVSLTESR